MTKTLFGIFLILHGLVHAAIWLPAPKEKQIFNANHSWFFDAVKMQSGTIRGIAIAACLVAFLTLVIGGIGILSHQNWALTPVLIGAIVSLILIVAYFNPWMSLAVLLDIGIIYLTAIRHWPSF
jgi:hypothetical protein